MSVITGAHIKKKPVSTIRNTQEYPDSGGHGQIRYIDVSILGNDHRLELVEVINIITHAKLGRYLKVTNCAFLHYQDTDILAIDIRKKPMDIEKVTVVVTEVFKDNKPSLMGFVINTVQEFCTRITFSDSNGSQAGTEPKGNCIPAYLVEEERVYKD